ncbi:MAG TPA: TonB-dependent receptor plug domain-containing protein, partial [Xanthobacteraceae bacterium]|nr:TonB-dependent receptor plug domain-containing protein [Xanthobacteraceae bacterium]
MFNLGTITITASQPGSTVSPTGVTVSSEQLYVRNAVTLDDALANIPGVNATMDSNARRNERDIFVRGFGRWQVPLTVDGVRVYLPADNRLDYNRFITPDLAEIQVEKGYASVLNGPGGMGGWINLVTRKPTKPFEGEVTAGMNLDNRGNFNGWQTYARLGTLQERYYLQGSIAVVDQDYWTLSRKYQPVPGSLEDGGRRINSDSSDWRANFKLGFTPNDTDEYVFNYIKQEGEKGAPLHVRNNPPVPANGFWRWPYWNIQNVSFHSNTKIGEVSYVKTKLYYNTFDNLLSAYDNITYTTQSANGRFDSYYNDTAYGASIEAGTQIIPRNTLKTAFHIRYDTHKEYNDNRPTDPVNRNIEPVQTQKEQTWSIAAENTFHVNRDLDWIASVSYDQNKLQRVEEYSTVLSLYNYPLGGSDAFNWQSMLVWRYSTAGQVHASVSS